MSITAARVVPVRLRFSRPVRTARGVFDERVSVLLELRDEDGVAGWGEAAPWPGFGTEGVAAAESRLREVLPRLSGAGIGPQAATLRSLLPLGEAPAARAALEAALCDLAARRAGQPLASFLAARQAPGTAALSRVPISRLLVEADPAALQQEAARARAAGFLAVKLKLGARTLAEDVARVRAAREGIGADVRLRADVNGAWTAPDAFAALEALVPFNLEYVEQPVASDAISTLAELRRLGAVRVAADEAVASEQGLQRVLAAQAADVVVLKPATVGGPLRALELAAQARSAGVGVVFTHTFESAVGARHVLHCAAAWGDPHAVHGLQADSWFDSDVAEPVPCRAGAVEVPGAPGIGVSP